MVQTLHDDKRLLSKLDDATVENVQDVYLVWFDLLRLLSRISYIKAECDTIAE